jgi:hypothetical protein
MFRAAPDTEVATPVATSEPIPLSVLSLDLPVPAEGWPVFLGQRGIAIIPDSLGRDSIGHDAARRLLDEKREAELRARALRDLAEQEAVERDQQRRASLGQGVKVPDGLSYAEAVMQAELDSQTYRPRRRSLVEDLLSNDGITFHPIRTGRMRRRDPLRRRRCHHTIAAAARN